MRGPRRIAIGLTLALGSLASGSPGAEPAPPPTIRLAGDGKALIPVVVAPDASARVRRAAASLAEYLGRIAGATFAVESGDGRTGIAVGQADDFPSLGRRPPWDRTDAVRREDYLLRSHAKGLHALGASDLAVDYAIWDLLYRLGHRQFFPGPTWEWIPKTPELAIAVDTWEHASYVSRDVGIGLGTWDNRGPAYSEWCLRNRMAAASGGDRPILESGHAYDTIVAARKEEFTKHPEYLALVGGRRVAIGGEVKFCISNPGLRKLVADYAVDQFAKNPEASSLSLEPSDGLGWCECEPCRAIGSVSDRVVTLLNEAAAALRARFGSPKLISVYAYAEHAPPPHLRVDPQVVVNVATCMTVGDATTDELIDGWRNQGAQIGIREYYGVFPWDRDLPGRPRMADRELLKQTTVHFYRKGARFLVAESSDDWGVTGLGYYLTARMLWDVREADRIEALTDDFLEKAFGRARTPMAEFYRLIDASSRPRLSDDLLGRMYRALGEARKLADDPAVVARINDLVLYTRYVELYRIYASAEGSERQRAVESLFRFTHRIRRSGMVHSLGVWRGLPYYDQGTFKLPPGVGYDSPYDKDPWKANEPVAPREVDEFLTAGVGRHHLIDFTPVAYSTDLVPATPLALPEVTAGSAGLYHRDHPVFYTWTKGPEETLPLTIKAGLIYQNLGNARISLSRAGVTDTGDRTTVPPDQKDRVIQLQPRAPGLHRLELSDRTAGTSLSFPAGIPWTIPAGPKEATDLHGRWTLYFYVPRGTKVVAGYGDGLGEMLDASHKTVLTFGGPPDYFSVPVAPGQDGQLWKFSSNLGQRVLLTVPPYLARDGRELLLPAEVVRADAPE